MKLLSMRAINCLPKKTYRAFVTSRSSSLLSIFFSFTGSQLSEQIFIVQPSALNIHFAERNNRKISEHPNSNAIQSCRNIESSPSKFCRNPIQTVVLPLAKSRTRGTPLAFHIRTSVGLVQSFLRHNNNFRQFSASFRTQSCLMGATCWSISQGQGTGLHLHMYPDLQPSRLYEEERSSL